MWWRWSMKEILNKWIVTLAKLGWMQLEQIRWTMIEMRRHSRTSSLMMDWQSWNLIVRDDNREIYNIYETEGKSAFLHEERRLTYSSTTVQRVILESNYLLYINYFCQVDVSTADNLNFKKDEGSDANAKSTPQRHSSSRTRRQLSRLWEVEGWEDLKF